MAATIITITKVGASGTNIQIKINDGYLVPDGIVVGSVNSFRTWNVEGGHFFTFMDDFNEKVSTTTLYDNVGWIISSMIIDSEVERFSINSPCVVTIEPEV